MRRASELEGGFSKRTVGWMIGIVLGSLAAGALFSAFRESLGGRPDPGANTLSDSAVGHRALVELVKAMGLRTVSRRNVREGTPGPHKPLVLAEPVADSPAAVQRLVGLGREAAEKRAPLVLVLPKWFAEPNPINPSWIGDVGLRAQREAELLPSLLGLTGVRAVRIDRRQHGTVHECRARLGGRETVYGIDLAGPAQLLKPAPWLDPVVVCGNGLLVARISGSPVLFIVADPDLLANHGLDRADHAALVYDLLAHGLEARGVVFDETVHGLGHRAGLLAEALRFPLVLAVVQSLVLAGVVLWAGMGRFGKPLPVGGGREGTETLIDNTARLLIAARGGTARAVRLAQTDGEGRDGHRGNP